MLQEYFSAKRNLLFQEVECSKIEVKDATRKYRIT